MKTVKATIWIELYDDAKTDWIERAIEENLDVGEVIADIEIEEAS